MFLTNISILTSTKYVYPSCTPLVNHLSDFIWAMKCCCITGPWKDPVGEAGYSCILFQHLWKLSVDRLYWTTVICLETPYTWRNKYKLSDYSLLEIAAAAKLLQSCLTLCNPIDGSPQGSPVPGILQARSLEWVAIFFSSA